MKKAIFALIMIIAVCLFSGCAEIVYKSYTTSAGGRVMEWSVKLNGDSYSIENPLDAVADYMQNEVDNRVAVGRNAELIVDEEENTITLRESYASLNDMYIAYGYTGNEENEPRELNAVSLLFAESRNEVSFIDNKTVERVYNYFDNLFVIGTPMNVEGATLQFHYGTPYKTVSGYNADDTYTRDGVVYYVWNVDLTDVQNTDIILVQQIPRVWVWEIIAIAAGFIVIATIFGVAMVARRKKNAKEERD